MADVHVGVEFGNPDLCNEAFARPVIESQSCLNCHRSLVRRYSKPCPTMIDCPIEYRGTLRLTERLNRLAP